MMEGFIQGCRGLIAVDGAHLRAKYGGVMLAAIVITGENEIFPIAYGVYENESEATWSSFFYHMRELLKDVERENWVIVSDRQKGVEPTLADVWPTVSRRFCCNHLKAMEKLEKVGGVGPVRWLQGVGEMKCWARFKYDPELHSPETTSNWVESFNSNLGTKRGLSVLTFLEGIRRTIMVRHSLNQEVAQNLPINGLTTYAKDTLKIALRGSGWCKVFRAYSDEYEIKEGCSSFPVNITNRSCSCGEWQISGIPC